MGGGVNVTIKLINSPEASAQPRLDPVRWGPQASSGSLGNLVGRRVDPFTGEGGGGIGGRPGGSPPGWCGSTRGTGRRCRGCGSPPTAPSSPAAPATRSRSAPPPLTPPRASQRPRVTPTLGPAACCKPAFVLNQSYRPPDRPPLCIRGVYWRLFTCTLLNTCRVSDGICLHSPTAAGVSR